MYVCRYAALLGCIQNMGMDELVMAIRRRSQGFTRGSSSYRGVTQHKSGRSTFTCNACCAFNAAIVVEPAISLSIAIRASTHQGQDSCCQIRKDMHAVNAS